jgi:hypothetical protein
MAAYSAETMPDSGPGWEWFNERRQTENEQQQDETETSPWAE